MAPSRLGNLHETDFMPAPPAIQALILAAGVGRRLIGESTPAGGPTPKAALRFGPSSLLARHVSLLRRAGVSRISVVTGFAAEVMRGELAGIGGSPPVATIHNPDFREGSVVSLWCGSGVLRGGAPVILMDADVLYDHRLMEQLVRSRHSNCLLVDKLIEPGDEPVKLCLGGGRIVDFAKRPTQPYEWHGESVGFFRFDPQTAAELADRTDDYVRSGRRSMEYEEPIRDMIMASDGDRFGWEDITGLPWTEIDFPEDVAKARALLPELAA